MNGETFKDRIQRNRVMAIATAIGGILCVCAVSYIIVFFVVFVAVPLERPGQQIVSVLVATLTLFGYAGGWAAKSTRIENVDTMIDRMGPLQRKVLKSAIEEEEKNGGK